MSLRRAEFVEYLFRQFNAGGKAKRLAGPRSQYQNRAPSEHLYSRRYSRRGQLLARPAIEASQLPTTQLGAVTLLQKKAPAVGRASMRTVMGASRMIGAPRRSGRLRGRRLGRRGSQIRVGIRRLRLGRDGRKRSARGGMDDRRGRGRPGRQQMRVERDEARRQNGPDHQEILQDQHPSPASRGSTKD